MQFLTLEPLDFLHVQSFVNKIEGEFGCIDKSIFLHHGNIVWSGIQQKETQLLYFYVYHTLLPAASQTIKARVGSIFKNLEFATPRETLAVGVPREVTYQLCPI